MCEILGYYLQCEWNYKERENKLLEFKNEKCIAHWF